MDGIEYLHDHDVTHRDLKPENLLLQSSVDGWRLKIIDFGLSNTHEVRRDQVYIAPSGTQRAKLPDRTNNVNNCDFSSWKLAYFFREPESPRRKETPPGNGIQFTVKYILAGAFCTSAIPAQRSIHPAIPTEVWSQPLWFAGNEDL